MTCFARFCRTAACAAVCLLLAGCSSPRRTLLWYQSELTAVTLCESPLVWRLTKQPDGWCAALTAPDSVAGITFTLTESGTFVSCGSVQIPVTDAVSHTASVLPTLFSLEETDLVSLTPEPDGTVTALYHTPDGTVTVSFAPDGSPTAISTPTHTYTLTDLTLPPQS